VPLAVNSAYETEFGSSESAIVLRAVSQWARHRLVRI
jgi:hypothetical protein